MRKGMNVFGLRRHQTAAPAASPGAVPYSFTFGVHWDETPASYTPETDGHLSLTGGAGAGKTWFLRALADEASQVMDVHVADGWWAMHPAAAAGFAGTAPECADMLEAVLDDVRRRQTEIGSGEEAPRRNLIILDDARHLLCDDEYSASGDRAAKERSVACIPQLAASAGVFSSQWPTVQSGIPAGALCEPLSRLILGSHYGVNRELFDEISSSGRHFWPRTRQAIFEPLGRTASFVDILPR
jgi:hypothetical protein